MENDWYNPYWKCDKCKDNLDERQEKPIKFLTKSYCKECSEYLEMLLMPGEFK